MHMQVVVLVPICFFPMWFSSLDPPTQICSGVEERVADGGQWNRCHIASTVGLENGETMTHTERPSAIMSCYS